MDIKSNPSFYIVEAIIGKKNFKGEPQYLIKWNNYPITESTWEPKSELINTIPKELKRYDDEMKGRKLPLVCEEYLKAMSQSITSFESSTDQGNSIKKRQKTHKMKEKSRNKNTSKRERSKSKGLHQISQTSQTSEISYDMGNSDSIKSLVKGSDVDFYQAFIEAKEEQLTRNSKSIQFTFLDYEIEEDADQLTKIMQNLYPHRNKNASNEDPIHRSEHFLTFSRQRDLPEYRSQKKISTTNIFSSKGSNRKISQFKFLNRVQGKNVFELENFYQVTFVDGRVRGMKSSELTKDYNEEFVMFLESFVR